LATKTMGASRQGAMAAWHYGRRRWGIRQRRRYIGALLFA